MNPELVQDLKNRLRGQVLAPAEPAYEEARSIWNAMIDRKPALIARCLGAVDVAACVNFARENKLKLSIKGGGHNIAGLAVCDAGLMIDLALMRGVWVDRDARVAHAQAGCLLGDVDRETQMHGLAAILGFVSNTGIAGLTVGGGFGYLSRKYGWTSDNVIGMDVITAQGKAVRASEKENPDLFWGLRGGGGNFGVVTGFDYNLVPVGPEIMAGMIAWKGEEAPLILEKVKALMDNGPAELTCAAILRMAPPAPWLPKEIHGKHIVAVAFCHSGSIEEGKAQAAAVRSFATPVADIIQQRPYVSQQCILDATQPKGRRYYWKSEYLSRLEPELLGKAIQFGQGVVSPLSAVVLFPIGGRLNSQPEDHSAVGNRDARWVLNITASWEKPQDDQLNIEWARAAWRDMRRFSTGGAYINFMTEEEGTDRIHDAYRKNFDRLVEIKTKWDPRNLFSMNKNIAPAAG